MTRMCMRFMHDDILLTTTDDFKLVFWNAKKQTRTTGRPQSVPVPRSGMTKCTPCYDHNLLCSGKLTLILNTNFWKFVNHKSELWVCTMSVPLGALSVGVKFEKYLQIRANSFMFLDSAFHWDVGAKWRGIRPVWLLNGPHQNSARSCVSEPRDEHDVDW